MLNQASIAILSNGSSAALRLLLLPPPGAHDAALRITGGVRGAASAVSPMFSNPLAGFLGWMKANGR